MRKMDVAALLFGMVFFGTSLAAAGEKEDAKKLFQAGVSLLDVKDFEGAAAKFSASIKLYSTKNGLFNLANCYLALQRYEEAIETINALKTQFGSEIDTQWQSEISSFEKKMENEVTRLEIQVNVDGANVVINGATVGSTPLKDPLIIRRGEYVIKVEREGYKPEQLNLKLWEEKESTVRVTLSREKEAAKETVEEPVKQEEPRNSGASPKQIGAWASFGVGGASAVAAIITGAKQLKLVSEIEENCTNKECSKKQIGDRDTAKKLGIATNVLIGVAVAGVAVGTILMILDHKERKETPSVAFSPAVLQNGGGFVLTGSF